MLLFIRFYNIHLKYNQNTILTKLYKENKKLKQSTRHILFACKSSEILYANPVRNIVIAMTNSHGLHNNLTFSPVFHIVTINKNCT